MKTIMRRTGLHSLALSVAAVLGAVSAACGQPAAQAQPVPTAVTHTDQEAGEYTGSTSCRECHEGFYKKWSTSRHGLAMQPFSTDFALGQLKPHAEPITIRGRSYQARVEMGEGWVVERTAEGETKKYPMQHALGGKTVYYFLTHLERGRLQVLPLAYDVRRQEWFDTTGSAARGLTHFEDEVLDWRAPQLTFNTSCYGCHVSQLSANYDPESDSYHSTWTEPGINCETCHASAVEHVRLFRGLPAGAKPDDIKIIITKDFSVEQTNALCAPCHAKMVALAPTFRPGDRFFDNYDLVGPEHSDYYPDARDLGENYTYTSWRISPCAKSGQLSCIKCHTSSGRYRFTEDPDRACSGCHQAHVDNVTAHTHHKPDSAGSRCVACHMPTTEFARMTRSDHSMRAPTPATTMAYKSPNACNQCHADKDAAWADKQVRAWWSRDYQAPVLRVAGLVDAARKGNWDRLPEILSYLTSADRNEVFATALIRLLAGCEDQRKWPALLEALKDSSPLVRAAAAGALDHFPTREALTALLAATRDEYRLVRVRAAASLAGVPRESLSDAQRTDLQRATDEFLVVVQARPDDSASHHNLGNFYMELGELDRAVASFERAFKLLPDNAASLVNASIAYNLAGQNEKAHDCLRRALKADPKNAAANLNLGLLLGEMGRPDEAQTPFRAAFKSDPQSATAAYNLGVLLVGDRPAEAIEWCRTAYTLRPKEPKYAYTLAFFLHGHGNRDEAIALLKTVTDARVPYIDAFAFLGRIYEEGGFTDQAVALYRLGASVEEFPPAARERFLLRAEAMSKR